MFNRAWFLHLHGRRKVWKSEGSSKFSLLNQEVIQVSPKGGFYSEGADAFVISSNRQTLLFPELEFWNFEILKGSNHLT